MQKLVTVYLDTLHFTEGQWLGGGHHAKHHGVVEEHLREYLNDGWRVARIHSVGGAADGANARGWIIAVLEKN